MPNICNFSMKVTGNPENVEKFKENEYLSVGGIEWCFDQWTYEDSEWENDF